MALLRFGGDEAATIATAEDATVVEGFEDRGLRLRFFRHDLLHSVEELLRDERFVLAFVEFSTVVNHAGVDRLLEKAVTLSPAEGLASPCRQTQGVQGFRQLVERISAGGVKLVGFSDKGATLGIGVDCAGRSIVQVSEGRHHRPNAVFHLLSLTPTDVFRKVVDVIFGLSKHDGEHEFTRCSRVEFDVWKPKRRELANVNELNDPATVEGISCKSVGMPGEDAGRFTLLDAVEHRVENGAARFLGRLLLDEGIDDVQTLTLRQLFQFRDLVGNAPKLAGKVVSRFASVDEEMFGVHGSIIS